MAGNHDVVIQARGLFFRNDDPARDSFRIRVGNDLVLDPSDVNFVNSTFATFRAPNYSIVGSVPVWFSNNYGIQWTDGSRSKELFYHDRIQVETITPFKI